MVAHSGVIGARRADADRRRRLGPVAAADRLPPDRGPGLPAGRACSCPTAPRSTAPRSVLQQVSEHRRQARPASTRSSPSPASRRSTTTSSLANAGVAYVILKDWSARGHGPGPALAVRRRCNAKLSAIAEARDPRAPAAADPGHRQRRRLPMQVELRDGNFDFAKLQAIAGAIVANAQTQSALQRVSPSFRSRCRSSTSRSTGSRPRPCSVTTTRSSRRCRPISARPTSTSSTSSAAPSRSTCRPMRSSA